MTEIRKTTAVMQVRPPLFASPHTSVHMPESVRDAKATTEKVEIGVWTQENWQGEEKEVIGLLSYGLPTHWSYYLEDLLKINHEKPKPHIKDKDFTFDAGTTRQELVILQPEWERVLSDLDVI